eukprot:gnl/TRDRNA2_/TRDRNA2_78208_c0_seq1.p1 gnl/TRDRNA2_/TRDRNA2_78208_c0~~gnl/TRDRNA2_/TRDRNA2_78208_c0_seq1.p1  ORF type:complete len:204 (+),score=8.43 gnl/TRDRNA2_/TRDRNA2_78208_c0_seq1:80-613(+)
MDEFAVFLPGGKAETSKLLQLWHQNDMAAVWRASRGMDSAVFANEPTLYVPYDNTRPHFIKLQMTKHAKCLPSTCDPAFIESVVAWFQDHGIPTDDATKLFSILRPLCDEKVISNANNQASAAERIQRWLVLCHGKPACSSTWPSGDIVPTDEFWNCYGSHMIRSVDAYHGNLPERE